LSFPPIPWTHGPCCVTMEDVGSGNLVGLGRLRYKNDGSDVSLSIIKGRGASDRAFWKVLDFNNLKGLRTMQVTDCPPLPLDHLRMLSSLKKLSIWSSGYNLLPVGESHIGYQFPVEVLWVGRQRWLQWEGADKATILLSQAHKTRYVYLWETDRVGCVGAKCCSNIHITIFGRQDGSRRE